MGASCRLRRPVSLLAGVVVALGRRSGAAFLLPGAGEGVQRAEVTLALARGLGRPIVSTTAQRPTDEKPFIDPHEIDYAFSDLGLTLVLDAGVGGDLPSTVVDLTTIPPIIIREGVGPISAIA